MEKKGGKNSGELEILREEEEGVEAINKATKVKQIQQKEVFKEKVLRILKNMCL